MELKKGDRVYHQAFPDIHGTVKFNNAYLMVNFDNGTRQRFYCQPYPIIKVTMENYVMIDGKKVPLSDESAEQFRNLRDSQLCCYRDCVAKVFKPKNFNFDVGAISPIGKNFSFLPLCNTEKMARKLQLHNKLLIVAEALNAGEDRWKRDIGYMVHSGHYPLLYVRKITHIGQNIWFKDRETAEKAIEIAGDIFRECFKL